MQKGNNSMNSLSQNREKLISNIQDFLNYKRTNTTNFGSRLLYDFKVVNLVNNTDSIMVEFEKNEDCHHANHYWIDKKEFEDFMSGKKNIGINLIVDNFFNEGGCDVFQINLIKYGFKKMTIHDAKRFKGIQILHNGQIYKSFEVQVVLLDGIYIDKIIKLFVLNSSSAEIHINNHTVLQNKVEIKNGITFEDFDKQEDFVRKLDALDAIKIERQSVISELKSWFFINKFNSVNEKFTESFLKKMDEIK